MCLRLLLEKPRPNSAANTAESALRKASSYSARSYPCCSCSTIRRPISKLASTLDQAYEMNHRLAGREEQFLDFHRDGFHGAISSNIRTND